MPVRFVGSTSILRNDATVRGPTSSPVPALRCLWHGFRISGAMCRRSTISSDDRMVQKLDGVLKPLRSLSVLAILATKRIQHRQVIPSSVFPRRPLRTARWLLAAILAPAAATRRPVSASTTPAQPRAALVRTKPSRYSRWPSFRCPAMPSWGLQVVRRLAPVCASRMHRAA